MEITQKNIDDLINLVNKASAAIMNIYNADTAVVEYKADNTPLTQADTLSHKIITEGLTELFPDIPVISEEGNENYNIASLDAPLFWLVDPLDGTRDFVNRSGEFCVAIGLIHNGLPVFGIVAAPTFDCIYYGGPTYGAHKVLSDKTVLQIHTKALNPHVIGVSRARVSESIKSYIDTHFAGSEVKQLGSMLKQLQLAEGLIDIYPVIDLPMHLWDVAAGHAIILGAGGDIKRLDGADLTYNQQGLMIGDFIARSCKDC